jgi:ABC-type lipopolysaccharide export system ATPase subunit
MPAPSVHHPPAATSRRPHLREGCEARRAIPILIKGMRRDRNAESTTIRLPSLVNDMVLMTVAETVHVLNFGEIIARGNMAAIQQNAGVREVYLGM